MPPIPLLLPPTKQSGNLAHWLQKHRGTIAMAGLLAFSGPVAFFTGALSVMRAPTAVELGRLGLWWTLYGVTLWGLMLVAGYACERLTQHFARTLRVAIWLLSAGMAAALTNIVTAGRIAILIDQGVVYSAATAHLYAFIFALIISLLYIAHLHRSREQDQAAIRLAAAQMAQRDARRRIVQARLQEVQARIDPQLLFEMLDTVRQLYGRDAAQGERFLDELIAFLRAALPRLRSTSSGLLREVELGRAFVKLRTLAGTTQLDMSIEIAPDAMHARFPPGVLLPLLDTALGNESRPFRLIATRVGEECRLMIMLGSPPSETAVARVQSLLKELYGTSGKLELESRPDGINIIVKVPYEHA